MAGNELVVVTADHPAVRSVATPQVAALLDTYLGGTTLTGKHIIADLVVQLSENPDLRECTPQSLFKCCVAAAKYKRSFGAYGVWMVARKRRDRQGKVVAVEAVPQLAYQAKNTSARERGAFSIQSEVVLKGERFEVHKDRGVIVGIDHDIDYTSRETPSPANTVAAWGVIEIQDGKRFYRVLTRAEIDRAHRAAASKSGPWETAYEAQVRKTVEHRMEEDFVGDFTQYGGGVAAAAPPTLEGGPTGTEAVDLADELFSRSSAPDNIADMPWEQAVNEVEFAGSLGALRDLNAQERARQQDGKAHPRRAVMEAIKTRKAELEQQSQHRHDEEDAGGDDPGEDGQSPTPADPEQSGGGAPDEAESRSDGAASDPDAAPDASGDETQTPPEEDEAPVDEEQPPDDLPDPPPAFPALPEKVAAALADEKRTSLRGIDTEMRDAWAKLGQDPEAVVALIRKRQSEWGKSLSAGEANQYTPYKAAVLEALKEAGLPHEV